MKLEKFLTYCAALTLLLTILIPVLAYYDFSRGSGFEPYKLPIEFEDFPDSSEAHLEQFRQINDVCLLPQKLNIEGASNLDIKYALSYLSTQEIVNIRIIMNTGLIVEPSRYTSNPILYFDKFINYETARKGCFHPFFESYIFVFSVMSMLSGFMVLIIVYLQLRRT